MWTETRCRKVDGLGGRPQLASDPAGQHVLQGGDQRGSDAGSLGHLNTMTWRNGQGGRHLMPVSPSAFDDDP